ncbi:MAG: hypothetical protein NZ580_01155 [Bacteroidia bacterium]|nr:hypothetical protein [Bacteroidia bacterium]MDW8235505.1 hypothetical protein [Bacteroidia bacterium]
MRRVWVVDAGATKTEWVSWREELGDEAYSFRSDGINPEVEGWEQVRKNLQKYAYQLLEEQDFPAPTEIYFYGPALHAPASRQQMEQLLREIFKIPPQRKVEAYHDLLGAARSAWRRKPGVVAILGTGSNCALWDGENIQAQRGGHGYLLGDEGGGADLGKHFLSALLHDEVEEDLVRLFFKENPFPEAVDALTLRRMAYASLRPSAFLGKFAAFLAHHQRHPWVQALVRERFRLFARRTWKHWKTDYPIRYVGGVANAFSSILEEVTREEGGQWGGVVENVAEGLLRYHLRG